jgi:hypothetical protein
LSLQEKSLGEFAFTANFERAKIFVPKAVRCVRGCLAPSLQFIKVFLRNFALAEPVEEAFLQREGKIHPLDLRHSGAEGHAGEFFLQLLLFLRIIGFRQTIRKGEKTGLL